MEDFNKISEKILNLDKELSPIFLSPNFSSLSKKLKTFNAKNYNKLNYPLNNKQFIISKDKIISDNSKRNQLSTNNSKKEFNFQFPSKLLKDEEIKIIIENFNKNQKNNIKKIDVGVQSYNNIKNQNKKKKYQLLQKLIECSNNKNYQDIECILESPHRGVEKIAFSLSNTIFSENYKNNNYQPIFVDNNYKGYFYKRNYHKSKSSLSLNTPNKEIKKINNDKYDEIKKNKEINNPLKRLSIISGVSCIKLRKIIDFSLSHRVNNFRSLSRKKNDKIDKLLPPSKEKINIMDNNLQNEKAFKKCILENKNLNNNKCVYSIISLKSKSNFKSELNKQDSINLDNEISFENVIGNHFFIDKKDKNKIKNRYNISPINFEKDIELFKNTTIKNKIGAFYK